MSEYSDMNLERLSEPFDVDDIEWRVLRAGLSSGSVWCQPVPYITARGLQSRLDSVCTHGGWRLEMPQVVTIGKTTGFMCGLSIKVKGEWVTKWDVSEASTSGDIDILKSGWSVASKRAGVQWGIGRYLYSVPKMYADVGGDEKKRMRQWNYAKLSEKLGGQVYYWKTPNLPGWAMPKDNDFTNYDTNVTTEEVNDLKRTWKANHAADVTSPDDMRAGFERFVEAIVGTFPVGDSSCWTEDAYNKCLERANQPASESGIDGDIPFDG